MPPRILVIEDEIAIADFIERGLRRDGYTVESVRDGVEGQRLVLARDFDLVVLDRMLAGGDGLEVLQTIRRRKPRLPVVLLTARSNVEDRVAGLDAGASDYLIKPFAYAELAARVRAHLRRTNAAGTKLLGAGIELDLLDRKARRNERNVGLTSREFDLLAYFLRHPGLTLSRRQILSAVWGIDHDPGTNIVDVYVGYLRRKLGEPGEPAPLATVRTVGYRLNVGPQLGG